MSYFIIIRGPAGVGKTTIASALVKSLHGFHISIDEILAKHALDYEIHAQHAINDVTDLCISANNLLAANKIVIPTAQGKLTVGEIVIVDGNFYHKSPIEDLIKQLQFPSFVYTLKANLIECLMRNRQRTYPLDDQAIKDVFKLVSKFDYGVVVDTNNKTVEKVVREIMVHLSKENHRRFLK